MTELPSHKIPVPHFEMTLVWPLLLEDGRGPDRHESSPDYLERVSKSITGQSGVWTEWDAPFPDLGDNKQYAEWVYHHAFLRDAFYQSRADKIHGGDKAPNRNLRVLKREDMAFIETAFDLDNLDNPAAHRWDSYNRAAPKSERVNLRLKIDDDRVLLYVFDTGVVMLVLTAKFDYPGQAFPEDTFTLQTVLKLQDTLRRCYTPYWSTWGGKVSAGHCPAELRLIPKTGPAIESYFGNYYDDPAQATDKTRNELERAGAARHRAFVANEREPYCVEMWRTLMEPIRPRTVEKPAAGKLQFEQIIDDRVQILSYIAVPDPRRISAGDWRRLAVVDDDGASDRYPYSPAFATDEHLHSFVYDRFWAKDAAAPAQDWFNTRWLCCGYGFTGVGSSQSGIFTDPDAGIRAHFNHHYYVLGLIAHFHHASLLSFKQQLSDAVEALRSQADAVRGEEEFESELIRIEKELLAFRNVYWFSETSSQIQGQELHELFAKHLRTRELFREVSQECREANAIVAGWNNKRQTETSFKLTIVAAAFLMVNAFVSTLDNSFDWKPRVSAAVAIAFAGLVLIYFNSKALHHLTRWLDAPRVRRPARLLPPFGVVARLVVTGLAVWAGYEAFTRYVWPAYKPNSPTNPQQVEIVPPAPAPPE